MTAAAVLSATNVNRALVVLPRAGLVRIRVIWPTP